jgi:peptide-methionine (R)-S-oxide reductase
MENESLFKPSKIFDKSDLKKRLSKVEYKVTQEKFVERPFTGKYYYHFENGIYTCIICETQLFKSQHKFAFNSGWPAFSEESYSNTINYVLDRSHGRMRTEIKCKYCDSHLGHVFNDGPKPRGKRYSVNSASLNFIKISE